MRAQDIIRVFLRNELLDREVYRSLASYEKNRKLRAALLHLSETENKHAGMWRKLLGVEENADGNSAFVRFAANFMLAIRRFLGVAFTIKLLENNEKEGLRKYGAALSGRWMNKNRGNVLRSIIKDEESHEKLLTEAAIAYESELSYMQSVILGLNDGLVEILAVVAGLATVATSSIIVVILGIIAGISGTLSMAGGVYLSAKSEGLVENVEKGGNKSELLPIREAYYTGAFYFMGALLSIFPFMLGFTGATAVLLSIIFVSTALIVASAIIAVISGTSIRRRAFEMLAISLGAAFVTILFGTFSKAYFGISI